MNDTPPQKRKRRRHLSPIDSIMARERSQMEIQMRRNAVLQYVGEQLAELNAMLREAGLGESPYSLVAPYYQNVPKGLAQQPNQGLALPPTPIARPCAWCGRPGSPVNIGAGIVQDLCPIHSAHQRAQARGNVGGIELGSAAAAAAGFSVDHTDAPQIRTPVQPQGKTVMHPVEADVTAAKVAAEQSNGPTPPPGFEEIEDGE